MQRKNKSTPEPSRSRTDRDWVMIGLGLLLAAVFLFAGYLSIQRVDAARKPAIHGPVKVPKGATGLLQPSQTKTPSDGLTGKSMPLPDGVS